MFRKTYRRGHVEIYFNKYKIFSFNKDNNVFARMISSRKNDTWNERNAEIIRSWPGVEHYEKRVLFVVRSMESTGGMETRLNKFAKSMQDRGILPCFLVMYHEYTPLKQYPMFWLSMDAPDFQRSLEELLVVAGISVVEFQVKWESFLEKFDWIHLRTLCRTGCTVHEAHDFPWHVIDQMDYSIFVREKNSDRVANAHRVLNGVEVIDPQWRYAGQKKAVFISRLNKEKLPTLLSFCDFCTRHGLHGDIAAPMNPEAVNVREKIWKRYGQEAFTFLGAVTTVPFLKAHGGDYLFCAGVGQVVMEALAAGMPALVCSHLGEASSTFLSEENFSLLRRKNFVISGQIPVPLMRDMAFARRWKAPEAMFTDISFQQQFETWLKVAGLA